MIRLQFALDSLNHHIRADVPHAAMIIRALREAAKIAWRARQIEPHDRLVAMIRTDGVRVCGSEDTHDRAPERDSKMHRAGIVSDANPSALNYGGELSGVRLSTQVVCACGSSTDLAATFTVAIHTQQ